ncbi:Neuropeptide Y receptor [Dermatophagoides farinae]|uniref:Neuropeptide Y receptor n=1 Tax=Dermatophagoides farinae TaxID=6954 RepID=A0A922HZQ9_DERFA|nr:Neuropeptide Y receptor [Dermatophagoides farinae]
MKLNQSIIINIMAITTATTKDITTEMNSINSNMTPDELSSSAMIFETIRHSTPIATIYFQHQTHKFTLPWITMVNNMTAAASNSYLTTISDNSHTTTNDRIDDVFNDRQKQQQQHYNNNHHHQQLQSLSPSTMAYYSDAVSSSTSTSTSSTTNNYSFTSPYSLSHSSYFTSSPIVSNAYNYDDESEKELFQQYLRNQALETPILVTLIIVYAVLIFIGAFGNGLVCLAVARNPRMRTSQNLFIVNLAISDLLLCFFTIPFSLFEIATKFWPYGVTMCKLVQALEGTSIFVSTLSIIAIALDRYNVILRSVSPDQHRRTTVVPIFLKLILIWIIGIILSMPLFLVRTVESHYIGMGPIHTINFCIEKWPIDNGRAYYSVLSMLIQYVGPIIIVSVVYARLCIKLRSRTLRRTSTTQLPKLRTRLQRRMRKTNLLLISIALIFFISWLPLNVLNIVADFFFPVSAFRITFAICHMFGMSSACSNPFLYGWLNQTFRNEFKEIFNSFQRLFCRRCFKYPIMHRQQLTSVIRESDHSMSFSPNHRIIHYQPNNGRCTITDFSHIINTRTNLTNNNSNNNNKTNNTNILQKKRSDGQIKINYSMKTDDLNQYDNSNNNNINNSNSNNHINFNRNAHCKFKRLSLVDSRKRRRKRNSIDQTSLSLQQSKQKQQQQQPQSQQNITFKNCDKNNIEDYDNNNEPEFNGIQQNINKDDGRHYHQHQQQQK